MLTEVDKMHKRVMEISGKDPLPYGIEPNRKMLEEIIATATAQGILTKPFTVEEMFTPTVRDLVSA